MKPIKLFLDTANLNDIKRAAQINVFSGITTNPIILSKESDNYKKHVFKILDIIPGKWELNLEVKNEHAELMINQAKTLASWDDRIRVKLPTNEQGLIAASQLMNELRLNMTVIKLAAQAILLQAMTISTKPKDIILSVFCGRINQAGYHWQEIVKQITNIEWAGKVLAASIKTPHDISEAISCGADIISASLEVYKMAIESPLIDEDVELFNEPFNDENFKII